MMKHLRTLLLAGLALGLLVTGADAAWNLVQKQDGSAAFRKDAPRTTGGGLPEAVIGRVVLTVPVSSIHQGITEFVVSPITGVIKAAWITVKEIAASTVSLQLYYESTTNGTFSAISPTWAVAASQSAGYVTGIGEGSEIAISTTHTVRRYRPIAVRTLASSGNGNTQVRGVVTIIIDP